MSNEVEAPKFKANHDKSKLSGKELENIYISYEKYGERHLSNFIQAIWQEAYALGREDALRKS